MCSQEGRGSDWHLVVGLSSAVAKKHSQEVWCSDWRLLIGLSAAAVAHAHLWSLRWQWCLLPAPRAHVGGALLPESVCAEKKAPMVFLPLSLPAPQQWCLAFLAGPGFFLYTLCYGVQHPSPFRGLLLAASPSLLPRSDVRSPSLSTQTPPAPADQHLKLGSAGRWH